MNVSYYARLKVGRTLDSLNLMVFFCRWRQQSSVLWVVQGHEARLLTELGVEVDSCSKTNSNFVIARTKVRNHDSYGLIGCLLKAEVT